MNNKIDSSLIAPIGSIFMVPALIFITGVAVAQAATLSTHMDLGDRSYDVTELQMYLAKNPNNYPSGLVTGYYGTSTAEAVQKFQTNQGIVTEGTPETTGYGRVGPKTMARLNTFMTPTVSYQGSPVGDVYAAQITDEYLRESPTAVTIGWDTSELTTSEIMYATVWPFQYATAASVKTSTYSTQPEFVLKNLTPKTRYYYILKSVDAAGNVMLTTHRTFTTN